MSEHINETLLEKHSISKLWRNENTMTRHYVQEMQKEKKTIAAHTSGFGEIIDATLIGQNT